MDEPETPAQTGNTGGKDRANGTGPASVVLAGFESSHAAEHMVASLGHGFRKEARTGDPAVFVVTRNRDGSFRLHQSRVITASGLSAAVARVAAATLAGFMGLFSALKGGRTVTHSARERKSHVRERGQELAEFLDRVGPHAACVLIQCTDEQTGRTVAARATERGSESWHGSRTRFLALLDQVGDNYDWLRPAVAEPTSTKRKGS
jgi:hypothetical protein